MKKKTILFDVLIVLYLVILFSVYLYVQILFELNENCSFILFDVELWTFNSIYGIWSLLLSFWFFTVPFTTKYSNFTKGLFRKNKYKGGAFVVAVLGLFFGVYSLLVGF